MGVSRTELPPGLLRVRRLAAWRPRRAGRDGASAILARAIALLAVAIAGWLVVAVVVLQVVPAAASGVGGAFDVEFTVPGDAALPQLEQRSIVYAADGSVLAVLDREVSRLAVPLDEIPAHVRQAVITAEDRKFYEHEGYDVEGIGRALVANARARGITQGGSTITQQLAKTAVGSERSLERKISELAYAIALERRYSKDNLLERYLNLVYFGSRAYGVEAAAEEFFGVGVKELTVEQAALLAGLIRSPNSTDPRRHPDVALARRNRILEDMVAEGYVDAERAAVLKGAPLGVIPPPERERNQPHVVDSVEREFLANRAFGATVEERLNVLYSGGLEIHTTIDPRLQAIAREVIEQHLPNPTGPTGAITAVEPVSGRIVAAQGGLDYEQEQYDLATQARRQPGSAFKPFVYATALQEGFPLSMRLAGASPTYFEGICGWARESPPGCSEEPKGVSNYEGASYGRLDMRQALTRSVNSAAAQLILVVGAEKVAELAERLGVDAAAAFGPHPNPGIALGGLENGVTLLEMASAYSTFANRGIHVEPYLIDRVTDRAGRVVYARELSAVRVLTPEVNAAMVDIMQDVVRRGTGTRAQLRDWEVAGKTGTTQRNSDAWFVGYTTALSTAVWMGHPDALVPMRGVTGGSLPAAMWRAFMTRALEGREPVPFPEVAFDQRPTGGTVRVPDVVGLPDTDAMRLLGEAKLVPDISLVYAPGSVGEVVWQSPRAGRTAEAGDTVVIGVGSTSASRGSTSEGSERTRSRSGRGDDATEDPTPRSPERATAAPSRTPAPEPADEPEASEPPRRRRRTPQPTPESTPSPDEGGSGDTGGDGGTDEGGGTTADGA